MPANSPLDQFLTNGLQTPAQATPAPNLQDKVNEAATRAYQNLSNQNLVTPQESELERLSRIQNEQAAKTQQVQARANDYGLSSTGFLDPETSSLPDRAAAEAVNVGKSIFDGTTEALSTLEKGAKRLNNTVNTAGFGDNVQEAYNRHKNGTATDADNTLLNQPTTGFAKGYDLTPTGFQGRDQTNLQRLQELDNDRKDAGTSSIDTTPIANPINQQQAQTDRQKAMAGKSGLDRFLTGVGQVLTHPTAAVEIAGQSLPQAITAPVAAGSSVAQGLETYGDSVDSYQRDHNGQLPGYADQAKALALGTADGALNYLENMINHVSMVPGSKILAAPVVNRLTQAADRIAATNPTVASALMRTVAPTLDLAKNMGIEGLASAGQNQIENRYAQGNNDFDTEGNENAFFDGASGALAFGAPRFAAHTAGSVAQVAGTAAQAGLQKRADAKDPVSVAARNNTAEDLSNRDNENYNPAAAIRRAGFDYAKADTQESPEDVRDSVKQTAQNAYQQAQNDHQQSLDAITEYAQAQKAVPELESNLELYQQHLDQLSADPETNAPQIQMLNQMMQQDITTRDQFQQVIDSTTPNDLMANSDKTASNLNAAKTEFGRFASATGIQTDARTGTPEANTQAMDTLSTPDASQADADSAADHIISHPMAVNSEDLQNIVSNSPAALSPAKLGTLRALADSRVAENALKNNKKVSSEIFQSTSDHLSLPDYQNQIVTAVQTRNTQRTESLMNTIGAWADSHTAKADVAQQALQQAKDNGGQVQVVKTSNGWEINTGPKMKDSELRANGGLAIHRNSTGLVNNIVNEATAVTATQRYMENIVNPNAQDDTAQPTQAPADSTVQAASPEAQPEGDAGVTGEEAAQSQQSTVQADPVQQRIQTPMSTRDIRSLSDEDLDNHLQAAQVLAGTDTNPNVSNNFNALDREWTRRDDLNTNRNRGVDAPHRNINDSFKPQTQEREVQRAQTEATNQTANPDASVDNETNTSESLSTDPVTPNDVSTSNDTLTEADQGKQAPEGALPMFSDAESLEARIKEDNQLPRGKQNLVLSGFNQKVRKGFGSPLVVVPDFINTLRDAVSNDTFTEVNRFLKTHITSGNATGAKQKQLLKTFVRFHDSFLKGFDDLVKQRPINFRHQDYAQYILNSDGDFDQNTKTAIATGAFSWLAENGNKAYMPTRDMARLLGTQEENITPDVQAELAEIGNRQDVIMSNIGKRIYEAMGFSKRADIDPTRADKLQSALGAYALHGLYQSQNGKPGYLEQTSMSNADFMGLKYAVASESDLNNDRVKDEKQSTVSFARVARTYDNGEPVLNTKATYIANAAEGTAGIMNKLFGFESGARQVLTAKPTGFVQKKLGKLNTEVPSVLADRVAKAMKHDFTVDHSVVSAMKSMQALDETAMKHVYGYRTEADAPYELNVETKSRLAKNEEIDRALASGLDFADRMGDKPFWMPMEVWTNQRIGDTPTEFNPQGSKVHRSMGGLTAHRVNIDVAPNNAVLDENNVPTQYGRFLISLAQGMEDLTDNAGLSTVDKRDMAVFLPDFQKVLRQPENVKAVRAMQRVIAGTGSTSDAGIVRDAVARFGMNGQSFAALHNLAQYTNALEQGKKGVNLLVQADSDGVTNGPVLTNIHFGVASSELLKQGGFYSAQDGITTVAQYKEAGNLDYYQSLGKAMQTQWDTYKGRSQSATIKALDFFSKGYGSRSSAKTLATPFNYSAGIASLKRAMGRETVAQVYSQVSNLIKLKATNSPEFKAQHALVNAHLKALLPHTKALPTSVNDLKRFQLSRSDANQIIAVDSEVRGKATEKAINQFAGNFIGAREANTAMANATYAMAKQRYDAAKSELLAKHIKQGLIPVDAKGRPLEGLNQKALDYLAAMIPNLPSATTRGSDNAAVSGFPMAGVTREFTDPSPSTMVEVAFNKAANPVQTGNSKKPNTFKNVKTTINGNMLTNPGVALGANTTQSLDADISSRVIAGTEAQNVHDANIFSPDNLYSGAKLQNKATLDALMGYHTQSNMANAFMSEVMKHTGENGMSTEAAQQVAGLIRSMFGKEYKGTFKNALQTIVRDAYQRDLAKLDMLEGIHAVNQYGTQHGEYIVTDADRTRIGEERAALKRKMSGAQQRIANMKMSAGKGPKAQAPQQDRMTAYLSEASASTGSIPASEVMAKTKGKFANPVYNQLHSLISGLIPEHTVVNILDAETPPKNVKGQDLPQNKNAIAWSYQDANSAQINLSLNKNASPEVLLHELTHIALGRAIADRASNPKVDAVLNRTQKLLDKVTNTMANDEQAMNKFAPALANLDEFISWGMTHPEFQQYLDRITGVPEVQGRNRAWLGTAFKQFIDHMSTVIANVTGRAVNAQTRTALEALTFDVAHLVQSIDPTVVEARSTISHPMSNTRSAADTVGKMTHVEVFDSLKPTGGRTNSPEFTQNLRQTIARVADGLYGKLGDRFNGLDGNYLPQQVWFAAQQSGTTPYTTSARANGYTLTHQEAFAVEAIEAAVSDSLASGFGSPVNREIRRTWQQAKETIKPEDLHNGDWSLATPAQKDLAQAKWDHLFSVESGSGEQKHLSQFIAMAIAHEDTSKLLGFTMDNGNVNTSGTPFENAVNYFEHAVNTASNRLSNTHNGQTASSRSTDLATKLVQIELKNRDTSTMILTDGLDRVEAGLDRAAAKSKQFLGKIVKVTKLDQASNDALNALGTTLGLAAKDQLGRIPETLKEFRNYNVPNTPEGSIASILTEATNADDVRALHESYQRKTKNIEQQRETLAHVTEQNLNSMFENNGEDLTDDDRKAITYGLLRNDAQSLLNLKGVTLDNLHKIYSSNSVRENHISRLEKTISLRSNGNDKIKRAKALGYMLATRKSTMRDQALNAKSIATGAGTHYVSVGIEPQASEVQDIDALASLYAVKYTPLGLRTRTASIVQRETARGADNGIKMLLSTHAALLEDSANTLFKGNELSVQKGYIPEVTDPHKDIKYVDRGSELGAELEAMGYQRVAPLAQDSFARHAKRDLYLSSESGYQRSVSGSLSLTGSHRRGSALSSDTDVGDRASADELEALRQASYADVRGRESESHTTFDPTKVKETYAVPVYSTTGHILTYRYIASHNTVDNLLDRNNDFAALMGRFAGQNVDKQSAPEQNDSILTALNEDSKANILLNPNAYFEIGANAPTARGRQLWAMMPYESRQKALELWNGQNMYVRNDLVNLTFGHQKYTIANAFDTDPTARGVVESAIVATLEGIFGMDARAKAIKGERAIQNIMSSVKDFYVIRNVHTQIMNIANNATLLGAYGVNPVSVYKHSKLAVTAGIDYRKQYSLLLKYQQQQRAGMGDFNKLESLINETQDRLNANPLASFIAEGMMPTIVEDVQPDQDGYSYSAKLRKKFNEASSKLPASVVTAGRWAVLDKGTPAYAFLSDAAQFGDFAAKYALYTHMTTRKNNPLSHKEAIQVASDAFVNYDVPGTPLRQYLDDMGITMFTKYRIRVQRAMFYLLSKRPASAMAHAAIVGNFTSAPDALDPLFVRNVGNPFTSSVLQTPNIATVPLPWNLFGFAL